MILNLKNLDKIPQSPGVYIFLDRQKKPLYAGKSNNLKKRVTDHLKNIGFKESLWIDKAKKVKIIPTDSQISALLLEAKLIKELQPKFNVLWKDDKKYFYIEIDYKSPLPYLKLTHQPDFKNKKIIGPFTSGTDLKKSLRYLRKIFPYYTAKNHPKKPCQWCQLKMCPGPNSKNKEVKKDLKRIEKVFKGNSEKVIKELEKELKKAVEKEDFEKAILIRDKLLALNKILKEALIIKEKERPFLDWKKVEACLKLILKSKNKIKKAEAYDISNIQGKMATGSLVVFVKGIPQRNLYRKFKIKTLKKPNDFAMIKEIIKRRLSHKEWPYPDLILIDGGKGQLSSALNILKEKNLDSKIKILALAKKDNTLNLPDKKEPLKIKDLPLEVQRFLLLIRDEAHRFAVSYHRNLRKKELLKS